MKLTIIGYWGGFPNRKGASSCYLLEKDGYTLVLDMGSGALMTLQRYISVTDINAVVLSHYHPDHIADIGVLQHALLVNSYITGKKQTVPIYGHIENRDEYRKLNHKQTKAKKYIEAETLKLGPFFIRFMKTSHPVPCYGMRITDGAHTIVYTADSGFQESWVPFSKDADLLLADCNFYANQDGSNAGHMTSVETARIAAEANVKQLILTHLPHHGNHEQLLSEAGENFEGKVQLAEEGLVWDGRINFEKN